MSFIKSRNDIASKQASLDRLPPFPFRTRPFLEEEMRDRDNDRRSTNESCRIFSLQQRDLLRNCMPLHDRGRFSGTIRVKRHRQANVGFTTSINRRACPPFIFHPFERTRSSKRAKTMAEARLRAAAPVYIGRAIPLGEANPVIGRSCNPPPPSSPEREKTFLHERTILSFPFPRSSSLKKGLFLLGRRVGVDVN